ncbi:hypothetical protein E5991_06900 [Bifidobacterium pseudolongum]|uniref:Uncharacterized protein n=1 Tax=Bifidobacterium pseudolongum TaxID=1694 RepID=A0A4S4F5C5_9BIFI|nr:hypothetical protein [Bifidobacterium pseudolongum]THG24923.1 hypothetical protein E5991_06900 [Bifidobacterium pseudolongum]
MTDFRDVRVIADAGDGADIENMRVIDTGSAVTVVQPDYMQQVGKTIAVVAHGLVVLPCGQLTVDAAKAYKKNLPNALRRAGVLEAAENVVARVNTPPRDGGAVDGDSSGRASSDHGAHGKRSLILQHVLDALGFLRGGVFDLKRRFGA